MFRFDIGLGLVYINIIIISPVTQRNPLSENWLVIGHPCPVSDYVEFSCPQTIQHLRHLFRIVLRAYTVENRNIVIF